MLIPSWVTPFIIREMPRNRLGIFLVARKMGLRLERNEARKRFSDCVHKRDPSHILVGPGRKDMCAQAWREARSCLTRLLSKGKREKLWAKTCMSALRMIIDFIEILRRTYEKVD